jgi:hypothetical protein
MYTHGTTLELDAGYTLCDKGNFYFYDRKGLCWEVLKNSRKECEAKRRKTDVFLMIREMERLCRSLGVISDAIKMRKIEIQRS